MRLIDGTIQALPMSNYILERKETFIRVLENGDNDFLFAMLMEYFDRQPTAFDVEKVVAELDKAESVKVFGSLNSGNRLIPVSDAIDIVRKGGVE